MWTHVFNNNNTKRIIFSYIVVSYIIIVVLNIMNYCFKIKYKRVYKSVTYYYCGV